MSSPIFLCPNEESLIRRLSGKPLIPTINTIEEIPKALDRVYRAGAHLHCLRIQTKATLSTIPFKEEWKNLPLALYTSGLGRFLDLLPQLPIVRQLNLRVYIPTDSAENYTGIRILSSLGIETAVVFNPGEIAWEKVTDLMSYAFFTDELHAPIAPFQYLADRYTREARTDFGAVYFDDPRTFLHLNKEGQVALSRGELEAGRFVLDNFERIGDLEKNETYLSVLESWREVFLQGFGCASCPGWRICLGKFSQNSPNGQGCREFFTELIDRVESYQHLLRQRNPRKNIWPL